MSYLKKAVFGAITVFSFSVLAAFFGYLFRLVLARNLTVEEYGLFYSVFALISLLWIFKDLGLGQALAKYIPEFKIKKRYDLIKKSLISAFTLQTAFAAILALLLFIFADWLGKNYFHHPEAAMVVELFAIYLLVKPLQMVCTYAFQGFQKMRYFASIDLTRSVLALVMVLIGFAFIKDLIIPSLAYALSPLLLGFIFIPLLIKKAFPNFFEVKFDWDKALIKKLVKFGIPVMIGGAGWFIISYTDTLLLTFFTKMDQVGLYNAALPTSNVLQYFSLAMAAVLLPMTSEMWVRNHKGQLVAGVRLLYKYSFLMIIPISLAMFSFPEVVLNILFGAKYVAAANALRVLVIGTIFYVIAGTNFSVLSGIGKPKITSRIILIAAGINVLLNIILIPFLGIIGSAVASATGFLVMLILSVIYLEKNISVSIPVWAWTKIAFLGLIFISIVAYLKRILVMSPILEAIVVCLASGLVYIVLAFVLRIVSFKEIKGLLHGLRVDTNVRFLKEY